MSIATTARPMPPPPEKAGPMEQFRVMPPGGAGPPVQIGLIETMRSRDGRLPWLERHLARLEASLAALGAAEPPEDLADVVRFAVGHRPGDRVVRLQVTDGHAEISTRAVNADQGISVIVADEVHHPYPHKTTRREQFGRASAFWPD